MNTPQKKIHNEKKNTEIVDIEEIAAYLKYWKWFVASVFVALTMAFLYLKTTPPTYEIFSNILITSDENNSGSQVSSSLMKSFGFGGLSSSSNIDDEVGILSSHTLVKETVKELGLYTSYQIGFLIKEDLYNTSPIIADIDKNIIDTMSVAFAFKLHVDKDKGIRLTGKILKEKITPVDIPALPYTLHTGYGDITFRYSTNTKAVVPKSSYDLSITIISGDLATEGYQSKIDVGIISKRSNIIALSTTDHVLQRGKEVLDKLIELYNIDALSEKNKAALNTEHFINERLTVLVSELGDIERRVEIFKKNNQMVDVVSEAGLSLNRMGKMKDQMVELEIKLSLINMIEDNMKKQANKYELLPGGLEILGELSTGIQTYNEILLQRSAYLRDMNETNPTILTLNERIDLMRKNIITSISNVKSDLLEARKNWEKQEKELLSRISNMPSQEREFIDIQRQQKLVRMLI
ncbi:MAG: hypothetical protein LBD45_07035, partial [Bacteroidales bacterium]|nr:hypothetical protein [Bacteroidales bacterium]